MQLATWFTHITPFRHRRIAEPHNTAVSFDLEAALGYPLTLHLAPWGADRPFAWHSEVDGEQVANGGFLAPPGIAWSMLRETHGETLMRDMPESVSLILDAAPFLGVELAQACGQLPAAQELAATSPLLLILLVDWACQAEVTQATFTEHLAQRQSTLCRLAGLPSDRATARLLRRITLRPMIRRELLELKRTLNRPQDVSLLRHHGGLRLEHLIFLARYEGPRWPGLLHIVDGILKAQQPRPGQGAWLHRQLTDVERMLGNNQQALRQVATLGELQALHDRLVDRFNQQVDRYGRARSAAALLAKYGDYPHPPLPGDDRFTPVTSWASLLREGQLMGHCVGSYHRAVATERVAIYHLSTPEAVTVAIRPQGNGWVLSEARGRYNAMPSAEASQHIQAWLDRGSSM